MYIMYMWCICDVCDVFLFSRSFFLCQSMFKRLLVSLPLFDGWGHDATTSTLFIHGTDTTVTLLPSAKVKMYFMPATTCEITDVGGPSEAKSFWTSEVTFCQTSSSSCPGAFASFQPPATGWGTGYAPGPPHFTGVLAFGATSSSSMWYHRLPTLHAWPLDCLATPVIFVALIVTSSPTSMAAPDPMAPRSTTSHQGEMWSSLKNLSTKRMTSKQQTDKCRRMQKRD